MSVTTLPGGGAGAGSSSGGGGGGDVNIDEVAGTSTVEGGVSGSLGVGGLAADNDAAAGNPVQIGGVYWPAPLQHDVGDVAPLLIDNQGRLQVDVVSGGGGGDVNIDQVAGTSTVEGGVSGSLGVGGSIAHDAAVGAANPLLAGAEAADFDGAALPNAVAEGDVVRQKATLLGVPFSFLVNEDGSATPLAPEGTAAGEGLQVSLDDGTDSVFGQGDSDGNFKVVGPVADDAAAGSDAPVKAAGVADQVPTSVADGDLAHLITDLERYLRTVSKSHDTVTGTDLGTVNTAADDRDEAAQELVDATDTTAGTVNYPSDAGVEIGNRPFLSFILELNDVTSVAFEVSNDGSTWVDGSKSVFDVVEGSNGYAATHYTEPDVATVDFAVDWEKCGFRYIRCSVVYPDATNECKITLLQRAI